MKKYIIIASVLTAVLVGVACWGYQYWLKGSPQYSFRQISAAFQNHDTSLFEKYYDSDSVFENEWLRAKTKYLSYASAQSNLVSAAAAAVIDNQKDSEKNVAKLATYNAVLGKITKDSAQNSEYKVGSVAAILGGSPRFTIQDSGVATADITYENYANKNPANYPIYKFKIIMQRQPDRRWRVTDIQGMEDARTAALDDAVRTDDLTAIGILVDRYIASRKQPSLTSENWREVLNSFAAEEGGRPIPSDPLASYGNSYELAIQNGGSIENYVYLVKAKLSTMDNQSLTWPTGNWTNSYYHDYVRAFSSGNSLILGHDCSVPSLCYFGWGVNSSWNTTSGIGYGGPHGGSLADCDSQWCHTMLPTSRNRSQ